MSTTAPSASSAPPLDVQEPRFPVELFEQIIHHAWALPLLPDERIHLMTTLSLVNKDFCSLYLEVSDVHIPSASYIRPYTKLLMDEPLSVAHHSPINCWPPNLLGESITITSSLNTYIDDGPNPPVTASETNTRPLDHLCPPSDDSKARTRMLVLAQQTLACAQPAHCDYALCESKPGQSSWPVDVDGTTRNGAWVQTGRCTCRNGQQRPVRFHKLSVLGIRWDRFTSRKNLGFRGQCV